jgi:hypothetical protein
MLGHFAPRNLAGVFSKGTAGEESQNTKPNSARSQALGTNIRGQALVWFMGMLKKAASGVLTILPCSRTPCTLRASKWPRPCWTDFFEHSLQLMMAVSSWACICQRSEIFNSPFIVTLPLSEKSGFGAGNAPTRGQVAVQRPLELRRDHREVGGGAAVIRPRHVAGRGPPSLHALTFRRLSAAPPPGVPGEKCGCWHSLDVSSLSSGATTTEPPQEAPRRSCRLFRGTPPGRIG